MNILRSFYVCQLKAINYSMNWTFNGVLYCSLGKRESFITKEGLIVFLVVLVIVFIESHKRNRETRVHLNFLKKQNANIQAALIYKKLPTSYKKCLLYNKYKYTSVTQHRVHHPPYHCCINTLSI